MMKSINNYLRNTIYLVLVYSFFVACNSKVENSIEAKKLGYSINPVNIQNVKLTDDFWLPIIKTVQEQTIDYAISKCEEEGRLDNFLIAGGKMEGEVKGVMPFDDSDVYKIIEGASNTLISAPNPQLETVLDSLISIIKAGQEEDGYLTTWRTINPAKPPAWWVKVDKGVRWESLDASHELYNAGHMYEAAVVHYKATGKRNFLDIALKNADLMVKTFGNDEDQIKSVPGHQIIETGLIQLYRVTNNEKYLDLAKYFLDNRGKPEHHKLLSGDNPQYLQDHLPVIEQDEVVGHAVRAVYMYAAMTDIAAIKQDSLYLNAVNNLWENMVQKKMYITAGIGAKHDGEAFGENYELPNKTAYSETCAAIGNVYWNHRLHNMTGDVKYFDIIERTLYNGLISGLSLDGKKFFYPNALESDGVYEFNRGACTRQSWFDCSCCPTNLIRFLPSLPSLIYSANKDDLFVNLYASNQAKIMLDDKEIQIQQETNYPWNGNISITINPKQKTNFNLKLRVPHWLRNQVLPSDLYSYLNSEKNTIALKVNNNNVDVIVEEGYINLSRIWNKGDKVELKFPMKVNQVISNPKVTENEGKIALEYGPIVYAIEEIDNENFDEIIINSSNDFKVIKDDNFLNGVNIIHNQNLKAIPYYTWSNRGIGKMKVWIPLKP